RFGQFGRFLVRRGWPARRSTPAHALLHRDFPLRSHLPTAQKPSKPSKPARPRGPLAQRLRGADRPIHKGRVYSPHPGRVAERAMAGAAALVALGPTVVLAVAHAPAGAGQRRAPTGRTGAGCGRCVLRAFRLDANLRRCGGPTRVTKMLSLHEWNRRDAPNT